MLPYLKKAKESQTSGLIVQQRTPDETSEPKDTTGIEACADELIRAVHSKDSKAVASALKDAFDILDSMPHEEGEHLNESDSEG